MEERNDNFNSRNKLGIKINNERRDHIFSFCNGHIGLVHCYYNKFYYEYKVLRQSDDHKSLSNNELLQFLSSERIQDAIEIYRGFIGFFKYFNNDHQKMMDELNSSPYKCVQIKRRERDETPFDIKSS